jgi:hypothetical protein
MDGLIMSVLWTPFKKIMSFLKFIVIKSLENSEISKKKNQTFVKNRSKKFRFLRKPLECRVIEYSNTRKNYSIPDRVLEILKVGYFGNPIPDHNESWLRSPALRNRFTERNRDEDLKRIAMNSLNYGFEIENSGSSGSKIERITEIIVETVIKSI